MTQVQDMTDQQLNNEISHMMMKSLGWKLVREDGPWIRPNGSYSTGRFRNYCTDHAASLEVQAAAIEKNSNEFVIALDRIINPNQQQHEFTEDEIAALLTASPRERAMAAYQVLKAHTASASG
ncbi:hypothetical protein [Paenibacillus rhizophilus]|uniref:Phage ABA sandwich domain-containing protein n=1 Tax=Paenibacillus rhizophilus TaxID=1850366 RepID=A0A3N9PVF0_9BACL|nr:hypothetical protein [Paenibacillus rhizophilus]RQW10402.1 hypothetical protein EH198_16430 [Paenibacillus rhizophilus]